MISFSDKIDPTTTSIPLSNGPKTFSNLYVQSADEIYLTGDGMYRLLMWQPFEGTADLAKVPLKIVSATEDGAVWTSGGLKETKYHPVYRTNTDGTASSHVPGVTCRLLLAVNKDVAYAVHPLRNIENAQDSDSEPTSESLVKIQLTGNRDGSLTTAKDDISLPADGTVASIAAGENGPPWVVMKVGTTYHAHKKDDAGWTGIPTDTLYEYKKGAWTALPSKGASYPMISARTAASTWLLQKPINAVQEIQAGNQGLAIYTGITGNEWEALPNVPTDLDQIETDDEGLLWGVLTDGTVVRWDGIKFQAAGGKIDAWDADLPGVRTLSVGKDNYGGIYGVRASKIEHYLPKVAAILIPDGTSKPPLDDVVSVVRSSDGNIRALNQSGIVYQVDRSSGFASPESGTNEVRSLFVAKLNGASASAIFGKDSSGNSYEFKSGEFTKLTSPKFTDESDGFLSNNPFVRLFDGSLVVAPNPLSGTGAKFHIRAGAYDGQTPKFKFYLKKSDAGPAGYENCEGSAAGDSTFYNGAFAWESTADAEVEFQVNLVDYEIGPKQINFRPLVTLIPPSEKAIGPDQFQTMGELRFCQMKVDYRHKNEWFQHSIFRLIHADPDHPEVFELVSDIGRPIATPTKAGPLLAAPGAGGSNPLILAPVPSA